MKRLKCFVNTEGRFVMCEKFPEDEEHAGLNNMLDDFVDQDVYLLDVGKYFKEHKKPFKMGIYEISFEIEDESVDPYDIYNDFFLVLDGLKLIKEYNQ